MAGTPAPERWKILVVDDEVVLRRMFERLLASEGHRVTLAASGQEAQQLLKAESFDLLLLDKNLPAPDGVELAVQARKRYPQAVIVLLTAYASRESAEKLVGVADEYLAKPFELEHVRSVLNALMERRRKSAAAKAAPAAGASPQRGRLLVQLVLSSPEEARRVGERAKALDFDVSTEPSIAKANADLLIISAELCSFEVRQQVWKRQAEHPGFKVALLVDPGALADSVAAVSLRAAARLSSPLEDPAIDQALLKLRG